MKNTSVLFDTNVVIDLITKRSPFADASLRLYEMCNKGSLDGFISAQSIADIFFILRKDYPVQRRKEILFDICTVLNVADVRRWHVLAALSDNAFPDLEDGILAKCAEDYGFDFVVSRNTEDFSASKTPVLTPSELFKLLVV